MDVAMVRVDKPRSGNSGSKGRKKTMGAIGNTSTGGDSFHTEGVGKAERITWVKEHGQLDT